VNRGGHQEHARSKSHRTHSIGDLAAIWPRLLLTKQIILEDSAAREMKIPVVSSKYFASIVRALGNRGFLAAAIFLCCLLLSACVVVSDGAFRQVGGRPIDYEAIDYLLKSRASLDEVESKLGRPSSRETTTDGVVKFTYFSSKRRDSVERTMGVAGEVSSQTMEETVTLEFEEGHLVRKQESYSIK
jgi:outer membrane protein assembly factor BamE (lipoprotein component of BamABCDE complex)